MRQIIFMMVQMITMTRQIFSMAREVIPMSLSSDNYSDTDRMSDLKRIGYAASRTV